MNLRKERMKYKLSVGELSQMTRLEASVIREYEYNNTPMTSTHKAQFEFAFRSPKIFFGKTAYQARAMAESIKA